MENSMRTYFLRFFRLSIFGLNKHCLLNSLLCATCIAVCFPAFSISCQAQGSPYLYSWAPGPDSNPMPTEYGYVEQTNGHLHLEIPLGEARKDRSGSGTTQARLVYDSNFWYPDQKIAPAYSWYPGASWHVLPQQTSYGTMGYADDLYFGETDEDGVPHYFTCSASCYSTDGDGYWFDGYNVYSPDGSIQIMDLPRDYTGVTDANGNYTSVGWSAPPAVHAELSELAAYDTSNIPFLYWNETGLLGNGGLGPYVDDYYTVPSMSSAGTSATYLSHQVTIQVNSAFNMTRVPVAECVNSGTNTCTTQVVSQIVLPDQTSFTFKYDCDSTIAAQASYCTSPGGQSAYYGGLTQMTTPTGGTFTYAYQTFFDSYQDASLGLSSRTNGYGTWHYSQAALTECSGVTAVGCTQTMTTVEPNGRTTVTTNTMNNGAWPTSVLVTDGEGHNLASTTTQWDFSHANLWLGYASAYIHKLSETQTFWDSTGAAETKKTAYTYQSPQTGNVTELQQWGYYSGTNPAFSSLADVTTYTSYYSPTNSPVADVAPYPAKGGTNIINKPTSITVCNSTGSSSGCPGGGGMVSQKTITYDQSEPASVTGVANHDDQCYGTNQLVRGNPTTVSQWVSTGQSVTTSMLYDTTGQVVSATDGNKNVTQYSYTDNYYVDTGSSSPSTYAPAAPTHAHATTVTAPAVNGQSFITKTGYYYWDQKPAFTTDVNSNSTYYHYNDPLDRLTQTVYPLGWTVTQYTSPTQIDVYRALTSTTPSSACTGCLHTSTTLDGLQRVIETVRADGSRIDTTYNPMGLVQSVSNPYQSLSDSTYGVTSYVYDILNRLCLQNNPDSNSSQTTSCTTKGSSALQFSYIVNGGYKTDENGNTWEYLYDPLGRLASVTEPNGAVTQYTNDVLGNLLSVSQTGLSSDGETPRLRSFTYDGMSRLVTATNPESGTVCYGVWSGSTCSGGYDGNGNLVAKTDARGVLTQYSYDAQNRMKSKTYSGGPASVANTPASTFVYDTNNGTAVPNAIGRLVSEVTGSTSAPVTQRSIISYDAMGRIKEEHQCGVASICSAAPYDLQYSYDLAGDVTYATNGASSTEFGLNYIYDSVGRLQTVTSTWNDASHPATLFAPPASGAQYSAAGLIAASLGIPSSSQQAAYTEQRTYDNRFRPTSETDIGSVETSNPGTPATASTGTIVITGTEQQTTTGSAVQATGSVTITGTEGSHQVCTTGPTPAPVPGEPLPKPVQKCVTVEDTGTLSVLIDGYTATATYGIGSTDSTIVTALAASLNNSSSPVAATANGSVLTMTSLISGPAGDYAFSISNGADFDGTGSGSALTGGSSPQTTYDSGTITTTINGATASYSWGSGSTDNSIASGLMAAINAQDSGFLSARVSSGTVLLTSTQTGTSENWAISCSVGDTSGAFSTVSFATACNGMSGGTNASPAPPPVYSPATVYSYTIPAGGYAPNSNLLSVSDTVMGNWTYGYDDLNRLISAQASANAQTGFDPFGAALLGWSYDSFGNDKGETLSGTTSLSITQVSHTYTGHSLLNGVAQNGVITNQMDSYNYDASGDLLSDNLGNSYTYDSEGRLASVGSIAYVYDAAGRRVAKLSGTTPTNVYLLGLSGEQVSELDGNGNWLRSNVYAGSKLLATYNPAGLHFHFTDWLGSRRVQGSAVGVTEETCQSLPYGDTLNCNGTDATELHFTGKERDAESGLDFFGARYYGSSMARWISPDRPFADQNKLDPQSWNMYGYARNNPLSIIDPNGKAAAVIINGNTVTIFFPVSFSGDAATAQNQATFSAAITSAWTGTFGNYNVTMNVVPGDPGGPLTNLVNINTPPPLTGGSYPRPVTDIGGPDMNVFSPGTDAGENSYEIWAYGHETGHGMGEGDKYQDVNGQSIVNPGYETNIMGAINGVPDARDINNIIAFPGNTILNITSAPLNTESSNVNTLIPLLPVPPSP